MTNPLLESLGIRHPIIQAPMAGGMVTPALVAAVSEAGGLGSFAAAVLTPEAMREGVAEVRRLTSAPFNVNFFVLPHAEPDRAAIERSHKLLRKLRDELGIDRDPEPNRYAVDNREQIETLIELQVPVASFTFGLLDADTIARLKGRGTFVMGTATNLREAEAWVANGADAVCAQGAEAGGHRGTFIGDMAEGAIGTMALVPQIAAGIDKPVVAAGGIMNGRGIAAALALGRRGRATRHGVPELRRGAACAALSQGDPRGSGAFDPPDPRLLRPLRARHRQPLHAGYAAA